MTTQPQLETGHPDQRTDCAYCGHGIPSEALPNTRFGEPCCSEEHAEAFAEGVRAERIARAARRGGSETAACAHSGASLQTWADRLKRAACWGAPLLLMLALPLFWSGGALAAAGGSVLSLLALLACPLGMYFMMRAMGSTHHGGAQDAGVRKDGEPSSPAPGGER